jgi:hypothetical protein
MEEKKMSPFQSKSQQRYLFKFKPKIAKEFAKKTDFSKLPEKKKEKADTSCAASSASGPALFKEDIPRAIHTGDVFENNKIKSYTERPIGTRDLNTAEDNTLMGRLATRMVSRDYIDKQNLGMGTKVQRAKKAATADLGIPHQMHMYGIAKEKMKEGMSVEKEHTDEPAIQAAIAKDHIKEFPNYYPELKEMEKELKGNKEKDD